MKSLFLAVIFFMSFAQNLSASIGQQQLPEEYYGQFVDDLEDDEELITNNPIFYDAHDEDLFLTKYLAYFKVRMIKLEDTGQGPEKYHHARKNLEDVMQEILCNQPDKARIEKRMQRYDPWYQRVIKNADPVIQYTSCGYLSLKNIDQYLYTYNPRFGCKQTEQKALYLIAFFKKENEKRLALQKKID